MDNRMIPMGFPDWKRIGRHVGKKLRDIINPPADTGPSREERRAQRLRDASRGLVYFDEFDELEAWSAEDVDPIQRANTPLLKRSASRTHYQSKPTTVVLLCHDYSGGYHDYESVRPSLRENEIYACNYPQYIDTFVYFSHKLVCVPPPTWINTMHRNGVKVLGTFIVEPGKAHVERVLIQVSDEFIVAKQLADMADIFGFDGWLLNIELVFPETTKYPAERTCAMIRSLKRLLGPERNVVWYDALTTHNEVEYQNGLTMKNIPFALAADSLFTNYRWTIKSLKEAASTGERHGLHPTETAFGVDVWAQNTNMPGPPRITFPQNGGGGTNTGLALGVLAEAGFSTAIFGPAWTHEHFSTSVEHTLSTAERVERAMWLGNVLPPELGCDCHTGRPHHTQEYVANPIVEHAREFPAGSAHFFKTDFHRAFQRVEAQGKNHIRPMLGSQEPLPHLLPVSVLAWELASKGPATRMLYGKLLDEPPGGLIVETRIIGMDELTASFEARSQKRTYSRLCLFKLNILGDRSLAATIRFKCFGQNKDLASGFYMGYKISQSEELYYTHEEVSSPRLNLVEEKTIMLSFPNAEARLVEFGAYCLALITDPKPVALCQILNITIKPSSQVESSWTINSVMVMVRGNSSDYGERLAWKWDASDDSKLTGLPWSKTTGPFSHFDVLADGKELGKAYCTEFPIHTEDFDECKGEGWEVVIRGRLFGGSEIASLPLQLSRDKVSGFFALSASRSSVFP